MANRLEPSSGGDLRPIKIGSFTLTASGLTIEGQPTFAEYQGVGDFIQRAHKASTWWLADWIAYGESRSDWKEQVDALLGVDQLSEGTVKQYRWIARRCPPSNRIDGVPFGHYGVVAHLEGSEQSVWLNKSKTEGWSQHELRREVRAAQRRARLEGRAELAGMFRIVYADPPWSAVPIEVLCKLPVTAHVQQDAVLFMWVPAPLLLQNPGPREVLEAWGFTYKTQGVWDRVRGSFGAYLEITHENLIIATRGDCQPDAPTPQPRSIFTQREAPGHTGAKPNQIRREWIEKLYTQGPYLSLYSQEPAEGWTNFGGDPSRWASEAHGDQAPGRGAVAL